MRRQKQIPLSAFVNDKTTINNKKLTLSSKNITIIDELPAFVCSQIQSLNLPNNRLTSLKGIEQFPFLKQLNISQNKIQDGKQICRLKQLFHLQKLYLNNNPFLNQPINEQILDFILDKETDIQILSFQILSTLKDVQQKQIKIIFLKNYIQKIDMHQELKNKQKVALHNQTKVETQQLLNKIVPQFYALIEDPKLINKIKRQALQKKKRRSQQTIEQALQQQKQSKQQKIDQLIKDIVTLLHNESFKKQQSFLLQVNLNQNTISFSPDRRKQLNPVNLSLQSQEFSPVKYIQVSKDDATIEDITLTNTKHFIHPSTNNPKQLISNFQPNVPIYNPNSSQHNDLDNLQTTRKPSSIQSISQKIKQHSQFKQSYQSHIKKIKQRETSQGKQSRSIEAKDNTSTASKKNDHFKKSSIQSSYIKVIQQNQDQSQQNKSSLQQKEPKNQQETFKTHKIQSSNISYVSNDQFTPQTIETIYFKNLSKINPMFHLLYSPSNSLSNQQKIQLLQALKIDHKQKFIELLKEKQNNQHLMRENEHLRQQLQSVVTNNKSVYNQYLVYKEQFQWVDERQRDTNQKNQELSKMIRQIQASEKKKTIGLGILQNNYRKLKQACAQKHDRISFLENAQHKEEMIRQKRQGNIMKKYLKQLIKRASICSQVNKKIIQNNKNRERELKIWGMESFKFNKKQQKALRQQTKRHQLSVLRQKFNQWQIFKELQKKQNTINKNIFKLRSIEFMKFLKKYQAKCKLIKLKNIWANRFFTNKRYRRSINTWKSLRQLCLKNKERSIKHQIHRTYKQIFNALKVIVGDRKRYIEQISQTRTNRLIQSQFQRMIYIMRKQKIEIEQKYHKTRLFREKLLRKSSLLYSIKNTKINLSLKSNKKNLKKYLVNKNYLLLKKTHKLLQKKLKKFVSFCYGINFGVAIRMLKRQKTSNNFNNVLTKRRQIQFFKNLRQNRNKQINFKKCEQKINLLIDSKTTFFKLKFIKKLQVYKLKGKNYVQHRKIQQMNYQMDLNDQTAFELVKVQKQEITRCQKQIVFLKNQIQNQSIRQLSLLREKDDLMMSIAQSYQIMMELRREVDSMRQEYLDQQDKYNNLVVTYNQSIVTLQEKEKEYQWLYNTIKNHQTQ